MLAILVTALLGGQPLSLPAKVFGSAQVVEFTLTYEGKKAPRAVGRLLVPADGKVPALKVTFTAASGCPRKAKKEKRAVKLLAFFDAKGKQLAGVEQDLGYSTDFDPAYAALVEAVLEAKSWPEERMRAVGPEQLWQKPKQALKSSNPFLPQLAAAFLIAHEAAAAADPGADQSSDLCN